MTIDMTHSRETTLTDMTHRLIDRTQHNSETRLIHVTSHDSQNFSYPPKTQTEFLENQLYSHSI